MTETQSNGNVMRRVLRAETVTEFTENKGMRAYLLLFLQCGHVVRRSENTTGYAKCEQCTAERRRERLSCPRCGGPMNPSVVTEKSVCRKCFDKQRRPDRTIMLGGTTKESDAHRRAGEANEALAQLNRIVAAQFSKVERARYSWR